MFCNPWVAGTPKSYGAKQLNFENLAVSLLFSGPYGKGRLSFNGLRTGCHGDSPSMGNTDEHIPDETRDRVPVLRKKKIWTDRLRCSGTRGGSELTLDMRTMKFISGD